MRILIAPDKFKGSLSAPEVAEALSSALMNLLPDSSQVLCPIADGGDGTLEVLKKNLSLELIGCDAHDALGRRIETHFAISVTPAELQAFVEMAQVSGLVHLKPQERDPLRASTYGTGEVVLDAFYRGAKSIHIGLGGSATVDGGLGFLQALGASFTTREPIPSMAGGRHLLQIESIDLSPALTRMRHVQLIGLCDVKLPLLGPNGSRLYSPQKGATSNDTDLLEKGLAHFAGILSNACGRDLKSIEGTGAAGGLGLAILALGGRLENGFEQIARFLSLEEKIRDCDVVITGEGSLDEGSRGGKAPIGLAHLCADLGKPCYGVCGAVDPDLDWLSSEDFTKVFPLFDTPLGVNDPRLKESVARIQQIAPMLCSGFTRDGLR